MADERSYGVQDQINSKWWAAVIARGAVRKARNLLHHSQKMIAGNRMYHKMRNSMQTY